MKQVVVDESTLQQVLEALLLVKHGQWDEDTVAGRALVADLRAALAQQAEPVAQYSDIVSDGGMEPRNKFDTLPAAQQVEGEPS